MTLAVGVSAAPFIATWPPEVIVHLLPLASVIAADDRPSPRCCSPTASRWVLVWGLALGWALALVWVSGSGSGSALGLPGSGGSDGGAGLWCPGGVGLGLAPPQVAAVFLPDGAVYVSQFDDVGGGGIGGAVDRDLAARR